MGMDSFTQRYGSCVRTLYEDSLDADKRLRKTKANVSLCVDGMLAESRMNVCAYVCRQM